MLELVVEVLVLILRHRQIVVGVGKSEQTLELASRELVVPLRSGLLPHDAHQFECQAEVAGRAALVLVQVVGSGHPDRRYVVPYVSHSSCFKYNIILLLTLLVNL